MEEKKRVHKGAKIHKLRDGLEERTHIGTQKSKLFPLNNVTDRRSATEKAGRAKKRERNSDIVG